MRHVAQLGLHQHEVLVILVIFVLPFVYALYALRGVGLTLYVLLVGALAQFVALLAVVGAHAAIPLVGLSHTEARLLGLSLVFALHTPNLVNVHTALYQLHYDLLV